jgi:hypothetical protein
MLTAKNEMIKKPVKPFFMIAISPLIGILKHLKEASFFNVKKQKLCQF